MASQLVSRVKLVVSLGAARTTVPHSVAGLNQVSVALVTGSTVPSTSSPSLSVKSYSSSHAVIDWTNYAAGENCQAELTLDVVDSSIDADSLAGGAMTGSSLALTGAAGTTAVLQTDVTADTNKRLSVDASGKMLWGSGSGAGDTNLYRTAADTLKTDDAFQANSVAATAAVTGASATLSGQARGGTVVSDAAKATSVASGVTTVKDGELRRAILVLTVPKEKFTAAALNETVTIATLPAKTRVVSAVADLTAAFALGLSALTLELGRTGDTDALLVAFDADAAAAQFGLVDADLGADLLRASAVQGGAVLSWDDAKDITLRMVSDTDNLGDGSVTSLTAGSITVYLIVEKLG